MKAIFSIDVPANSYIEFGKAWLAFDGTTNVDIKEKSDCYHISTKAEDGFFRVVVSGGDFQANTVAFMETLTTCDGLDFSPLMGAFQSGEQNGSIGGDSPLFSVNYVIEDEATTICDICGIDLGIGGVSGCRSC